MKKILVTGADGFIGSHLVEYLVKKDYKVKALTLYNLYNSWGWLDHLPKNILNSVDVHMGDIRDTYNVAKAVRGCDYVLHLAALIAIPYSYYAPQSYIDVNVNGTLNILEASKQFGIKKVIQTSTSEVYGSAQYVPIDENHPLVGQSPYSASKIAADQLAYSFYSSFNTPVTIIRPFNTFGPRQSARAIIPTIICQLLNGRKNIELGSLLPKRDFNYVNDIVRGFERALFKKDIIGEVINLGTNYEISIKDLVKLIAEILGVSVKITCNAERTRPEKSEVDRLLCNNNKANKLLDWKPNFYGLEGLKQALTETIKWFSVKKNLNLYKSNIYNL